MLDIRDLRNAIVGPLSLQVSPGQCAAIAGPSGSGKSLFLRMIADLDPHGGTVRLGDRDRAATPAPAWRRTVTYVAAEAGWWSDDVADHFAPAVLDAAAALAERLSLDPGVFARAVRLLSTGERQRLGLVRALLLQPRVLLLDEPTSALDATGTGQVETLLRECLRAGTIVILVTHDDEQGGRLGDQRYAIAGGRLVPR